MTVSVSRTLLLVNKLLMSSSKGNSGIALIVVLASWASLTSTLWVEGEYWKLGASGVFTAPKVFV